MQVGRGGLSWACWCGQGREMEVGRVGFWSMVVSVGRRVEEVRWDLWATGCEPWGVHALVGGCGLLSFPSLPAVQHHAAAERELARRVYLGGGAARVSRDAAGAEQAHREDDTLRAARGRPVSLLPFYLISVWVVDWWVRLVGWWVQCMRTGRLRASTEVVTCNSCWQAASPRRQPSLHTIQHPNTPPHSCSAAATCSVPCRHCAAC